MEQQHFEVPADDSPLDTASGVIKGVVFSLVVLWPPIVVAAFYAATHYS